MWKHKTGKKKNVMWSKGCGIAVFKLKSCESWWITQQTVKGAKLNEVSYIQKSDCSKCSNYVYT